MFSTITSGAIHGISSQLIEVEVDASNGLPCFEMVGLLNSEVREAKERVRVALKNSGYQIPPIHLTVNLSPADVRKEGTAYDVPIAVGILQALGYVKLEATENTAIMGELGLNGEVKRVKGMLPIVKEAKERGIKRYLVPEKNKLEGAVVDGIEVYGMDSLGEVISFLKGGRKEPEYVDFNKMEIHETGEKLDFADIVGQENVKRAVQISAAGFHHLLMTGQPGSGKTMIAKRISGILPRMTFEESLEVSSIYSVAGLLTEEKKMIIERPYCAPHHTVTKQALIGGGNVPKPGMISLAHKGILFLDELAEFRRETLDVLRQPLEEKKVYIARVGGNYTYPADFLLIGATNLCPCGYYPDLNQCNCTSYEIRKYMSRVSGPLLERMDLITEIPRVSMEKLQKGDLNRMTTKYMKEQVEVARKRQIARFQNTSIGFNAQMGIREIHEYCSLGNKEQLFMKEAFEIFRLSARTYHKVLRVARTIADLDDQENITEKHLSEALCFRVMEQHNSMKYREDRK